MPEKVLRYDLVQHICFEITGQDLNPSKVNPLIEEFHNKLDNFRYESHPFKIVPIAVDEFSFKEIDSSKVIGSYQIRFEIIDMVKENAMFRKNNNIRPLITRLVKGIKVEGEKVYGYSISVKVINSRFDDEYQHGIWP